ncbi:MAG TPA: hypothetical protein GX699_09145, partial [Firmicutes bacterium]|nr:hypothetical protein [Bacillota bacterium]
MIKWHSKQNRHSGRKSLTLYLAGITIIAVLLMLLNLPYTQAYFSKYKKSDSLTMLVIGADSITITGPEAIDLPSSSTEGGDEEGIALLAVDTAWAVYQAEVLDQFGRPLPDEAVIWDILDGPHTGISLSRNGELSITPEAAPGIYTIVAISASDKNVMAFFEIELVAPETDENDEDPGDEPGEDPAPTDEDPAPGDDEPGD